MMTLSAGHDEKCAATAVSDVAAGTYSNLTSAISSSSNVPALAAVAVRLNA